MKKFALLAMILATACTVNPTDQVTSVLKKAVAEGKILYGHQDDLMYGHTWNATEENDHSFERSDVLSVAGDYPAILGLELGEIELGGELSLDGVNFDLIREAAVKHYQRGGIVTISWHPRNPVTGGTAWDVSGGNVVERLLPGGDHYNMFMGWLDTVADFLSSIKTPDGKPIPIIWRPWHEHTGNWFWWCWPYCTDNQFNSFWVMTYDYLARERGLRNLLWAISPNGVDFFEDWPQRYPGDDYVDIVGLDMYCPTWMPQPEAIPYYIENTRLLLASLQKFAEEHGKILAFTETGYEGLTWPTWWTEVLAPAIKGFPIAYFLTWRNTSEPDRRDVHFYAPFPGGPTESDFVEFIKDNNILLLNGIK
ncbi:MAG: beta-mannosidase [Bacteroidales bacterium]|nr:beta-mannosidase [Bacteroidales bacterium]